MPYILLYPLPPPKRNPYDPYLPTFTTSSRAMAHFFHSKGWRACHVYTDTSSTSALSAHAPECCASSTGSTVRTCGALHELHSYQIPLQPALFNGPGATPKQLKWLRWLAFPHISFDDEEGGVDLHMPNLEGLARKKADDEVFWRAERNAAWQAKWKTSAARALAERRVEARSVQVNGGQSSAQRLTVEEFQRQNWRPTPSVQFGGGRREEKPVVEHEEEENDEESLQLISLEQDEEMDEELGERWEMQERALLAGGGLEWADDGETLMKTGFI